MYRRLKSPTSVQIELTERCPNACSHCYNGWRDRSQPSYAGRDFRLADVLPTITMLHEGGVFQVVLTGGEPFLNKPALYEFVRGFRNVGISCSVNSSLLGMTPVDVAILREQSVGSVLTSVLGPTANLHDSITQHPGSFELTVRGIRMLVTAGRPPAVNMVVTSRNIDHVRDTALFVRSLGVRMFNATRAGCPSNCDDFNVLRISRSMFQRHLRDLADIATMTGLQCGFLESYPLCGIGDIAGLEGLLGRKCLAGVMSFTISATGDVRPCSHLDLIYGNLFEHGFKTVWKNMDEWANGSFVPDSCKSCVLLKACGGGCRMEAKTQCNDIRAMDPFSDPSTVNLVREQIIQFFQQENDEPLPTRFRVNPICRFRDEAFGGIAYMSPRDQMLLSTELNQWLQSLQREGTVIETNVIVAGRLDKQKILAQMAKHNVIQAA